MACHGTPRVLSCASARGASPRRASAISMREEANRPLLSADSTAVRMTAFMMWAAPGMCSCSSAPTYGCSMRALFHGSSVTTTKIEPT